MFKNIFRKGEVVIPEEQLAQWQKMAELRPLRLFIKQKAIKCSQ